MRINFFLSINPSIVNIDRVERFTDKYIELKGIEEPIDLSREKKNCIQAENASVSGRAGVGGYGNYNQLCICTYYRSYNIVDEYVADV